MGSVQRNSNGDLIEDTSLEQSPSPDSENMNSVFGDPEIHPRVGEEYQVETPPLISKSQHHLYHKSPFESDFLSGLPIPIMHINKEVNLENGLFLCKSAKEKKAYKKHVTRGYCLLPDTDNDPWNETQEGCFLLGLYIFGKDLVLVKKFVEDKSMGDIQEYYYGKFYKTNEYKRWSECKKVRNRKCVYGHKLFSGMRQQELISRLFQHVSEEFQSSLSKASKSYSKGKLSLPEYVFTLKALVGPKKFVDAMEIGKGKRDLTSITMEPPRANQIAPHGKACSSLTPQEIAKFLTGGFRISKAKSNDLFWEAVWPRLLARGWHSEEPKDQIYSFGTKGGLVFLTPGIKKFSRKLVKGNHYFDCVMDVLSKVASDPILIELEREDIERTENGSKEDGRTRPENGDLSSQRRHRYLQPRTPNREKGVMKFTIVDTSMARTDGKVYRIGELTLVGNKVSNPSIVTENSNFENSSQDSYEDCEYIKNSPTICSLFREKIIETELAMDETNDLDFKYKIPKRIGEDGDLGKEKKPYASSQQLSDMDETNGPDFNYKIPKRAREDGDLGEKRRPKKSPKYYRGLKKVDKIYLSPVAKKSRKLISCTKINNISCSEATDSSEKSQKASSFEGSQGFACETGVCLEGLSNKPKSRVLIDLNLPQVSPELENGEDLPTGSKDEKVDEIKKAEICIGSKYTKDEKVNEMKKAEIFIDSDYTGDNEKVYGLKKAEVFTGSEYNKDEEVDEMKKAEILTGSKSTSEIISDQQTNINSRRQSTRNRPPTLRALEALANGFLTVNTRKMKKPAGPSKTLSSRPRHSSSGGTEGTKYFCNNGSEDTNMADLENVESNDDSGTFGKFHIFPDGNVAQGFS